MILALTMALVLSVHGTASSQTTSNRLEFEVASVRRVGPVRQEAGSGRRGSLAGSVTVTSDRATYRNVTLKTLLMKAYSLKAFQVSGPAWIDSERYDIVAIIPENTQPEDVPVMLQHLLEERFRATLHSETKQHSGYSLGIGKGGPKLKLATEQNKTASLIDPDAHRAPMVTFTTKPGDESEVVKLNGMTMSAFADFLSRILGSPIIDLTGLSDKFDITLSLSMGVFGVQGANADGFTAESDSTMASLFTAVHDLGLKLDSTKVPTRFIVVEKALKIPTEN